MKKRIHYHNKIKSHTLFSSLTLFYTALFFGCSPQWSKTTAQTLTYSTTDHPLNFPVTELSIDTQRTFQTIEGFGASGAWWAPHIGKWKFQRQKIADLLFSIEKGIGLSIYRYNLGGGRCEESEHSMIPDDWRRGCSLEIKDGQYGSDLDPGGLWFLKEAQRAKVSRLVVFANSPAKRFRTGWRLNHWKDGSGKIDILQDTALPSKIAHYFAGAIQYLMESEKITIHELSPFNEPQWKWEEYPNSQDNQEGLHLSPQELILLSLAVKDQFKRTPSLQAIEISGPESATWIYQKNKDQFPWSNTSSDSSKRPGNIFPMLEFPVLGQQWLREFKTFGVHSYYSSAEDKRILAAKLASTNTTLHMTEWAQLPGSDPYQAFEGMKYNHSYGEAPLYKYQWKHKDIEAFQRTWPSLQDKKWEAFGKAKWRDYGMSTALNMALKIHEDIVIGHVSSWQYWLAVSVNGYVDGLIYAHKSETEEAIPSKRLWALGNFSRFIRPGYQRIASILSTSPLHSLSFRSPDEKTVVTVIINPGISRHLINLSLSNFSSLSVYETSWLRNLEKTYSGRMPQQLALAPRSIVSLIFSNEELEEEKNSYPTMLAEMQFSIGDECLGYESLAPENNQVKLAFCGQKNKKEEPSSMEEDRDHEVNRRDSLTQSWGIIKTQKGLEIRSLFDGRCLDTFPSGFIRQECHKVDKNWSLIKTDHGFIVKTENNLYIGKEDKTLILVDNIKSAIEFIHKKSNDFLEQ